MSTVLGKECYVLHVEKSGDEVSVQWIDAGKIRYGEYKLYIYKDDQLYFKDSIDNIYVKRIGNIVLINSRDNKHRFEIVVKNKSKATEIVDLGLVNSLLNKKIQ